MAATASALAFAFATRGSQSDGPPPAATVLPLPRVDAQPDEALKAGPTDVGTKAGGELGPPSINCAPGDPLCGDEQAPDPVDQAMAHLRQAALAFNAPTTIALGETAQVKLLLSPAQSPEALAALIDLPGDKRSAAVRASSRMEARLIGGDAFDVTALTPEEQAVPVSEPTEWRWSVRPQYGGRSVLTLSVTALFPLEGTTARRSLKVFEETIDVKVTLGQRVAAFVEGNWQWLWTTFLAPLAVWLWARRRGTREPAPAPSHSK